MKIRAKILTGVSVAALALTGCAVEDTGPNTTDLEEDAQESQNVNTELQEVMYLRFFAAPVPSFGGRGTARLLCDNDNRAFLQVSSYNTTDITRVEDYDTKCEDIVEYESNSQSGAVQ